MIPSTLNNFSDLLGQVDEVVKTSRAPVGLLMGELHGVGKINARFGYSAGDAALDVFHQKLRVLAREHDVVLKIGGTGFALIISNPLHEGHVMLAAEKVAQLASEWIAFSDVRLRLEVNIGVSLLPMLAETAEELLGQAEEARRRSEGGSEQFMLWRQEMDNKKGTLTHPLFDAKKAIEDGEFRLQFQPKVDLQTGALIGAEALVRWQSPGGLVSPANFLSEVERSRAMGPLLHFVLNSSAKQLHSWSGGMPDISVSFNATTSDIEDADLVEIVSSVLNIWDIAPQLFTLELTETMIMNNVEKSIDTLSKLRDLGIRSSIDDFGTGYSSFAYLRDLPVDELKVDRQFVSRILSDDGDRQIVETMIALAHAMKLEVVAEGIESNEIASKLKAMGCDIGQGYYFGKPMHPEEFEQAYMKRRTKPVPATVE